MQLDQTSALPYFPWSRITLHTLPAREVPPP